VEDGEQVYANIRQILGKFIGQKLLDIKQHDEEEYKETKQSYVMLMFETGYIKYYVSDDEFDADDGTETEEEEEE